MSAFARKCLLSTAVAAVMAVGAAAFASAAPVGNAVRHDAARLASPAIQDVHWEWHHHHRVWVPDHHRYYR